MKRFWMVLAWLMVLPLASHADTITVGGKSLTYQTPAGYVVASKSKYSEPLAFLKKALPANTVIHEVYIEKEVDRDYGKKNHMLDDYIVIVSHVKSDTFLVGLADFEKLKDQITKIQETQLTTSVKERSNQRLDEVTEGALKIGNVRPMGILESTDTLISFMAVMSQSANINGKSFNFDQAFVSTTLLTESKVLSINHYRTIHSEEDISRFKSDALRAVASMDFKQGAAAGITQTRSASASASSSSPLSSTSSDEKKSGMSRLVSGLIFGGIAAGIIYLFR
ncbi:MAG: hypothetical protein GX776_10405, partial [Oxalobacter sp.]|nr:hypothetical protein [Oxalobacter sp.]